MKKNNPVEYIAHAMIEYDKKRSTKTWRELAQVAYTACMEYLLEEHVRELAMDMDLDYHEAMFQEQIKGKLK